MVVIDGKALSENTINDFCLEQFSRNDILGQGGTLIVGAVAGLRAKSAEFVQI